MTEILCFLMGLMCGALCVAFWTGTIIGRVIRNLKREGSLR